MNFVFDYLPNCRFWPTLFSLRTLTVVDFWNLFLKTVQRANLELMLALGLFNMRNCVTSLLKMCGWVWNKSLLIERRQRGLVTAVWRRHFSRHTVSKKLFVICSDFKVARATSVARLLSFYWAGRTQARPNGAVVNGQVVEDSGLGAASVDRRSLRGQLQQIIHSLNF